MTAFIFILAALGCCACFILARYAPLRLSGAALRRFRVCALAVNAAALAALWGNADSAALAASRFFLLNMLLFCAATDLRELAVYDVHTYLLLLGGGVGAVFVFGAGFPVQYLAFGVSCAVLRLASRRGARFGAGDCRVIAAMALYFPLSRWMEVMLLSLFGAMLWGIAWVAVRRKTLRDELPFMPFLLVGVLIENFL